MKTKTTLYIDEDLYKRLAEAAKRRGMSRSHAIREALRLWLELEEKGLLPAAEMLAQGKATVSFSAPPL
mgnify:CR=1 FL=1